MAKTTKTPVAPTPAPSGAGELAVLKRAARRRQAADQAYDEALRAAVDAGVSYSEIAKQLGTTRQAVRQLYLYERRR